MEVHTRNILCVLILLYNNLVITTSQSSVTPSPTIEEEQSADELVSMSLDKIVDRAGIATKIFLVLYFLFLAVALLGTLLFLFLLSVILMVTWKFQNLLGKMFLPIIVWRLVNLGAAVVKAPASVNPDEITHCNGLDLLLTFAMLSDFTWLALVNYNFWCDLGRKNLTAPNPNGAIRREEERWKYFKYSLVGWCIPIFILGMSFGVEKLFRINELLTKSNVVTSSSGSQQVILCNQRRLLKTLLYVTPASTIFMVIILTFAILTIKSIRKQQSIAMFATASKRNSSITNFRLFWKLSVFMGLEMVLHHIFYISLMVLAPAMEKKYVSPETGSILYLTGASVLIVVAWASATCLLYFFFWSKRKAVAGQVRQVFWDCWSCMGSCRRKIKGHQRFEYELL